MFWRNGTWNDFGAYSAQFYSGIPYTTAYSPDYSGTTQSYSVARPYTNGDCGGYSYSSGYWPTMPTTPLGVAANRALRASSRSLATGSISMRYSACAAGNVSLRATIAWRSAAIWRFRSSRLTSLKLCWICPCQHPNRRPPQMQSRPCGAPLSAGGRCARRA